MNSFVLSYVAKVGAQLVNDVAEKHENDVFLPQIVKDNPRLYNKSQLLLKDYCDLIIEMSDIFIEYHKCKKSAKMKLRMWLDNVKKVKIAESRLYHDASTEIGGDH